MKKITMLLTSMTLMLAVEAQAVSLSNLITPYAKHGSGIDWSDVTIKGINWKNTSDGSSFSRTATVNIDRLGKSEIRWVGPRSMAYQAEISANYLDVTPSIKSLIGQSGSIQKIRGNCSDEGALYYSNAYKVHLKQAKPVYIKELISAAPSSPGGSYDLYISTDIDDMKC